MLWPLVYSISSPLLIIFFTNTPILLNYTRVSSSFKDENLCCQTLDSAGIFCSGSNGYQVGLLIKVTVSIKSLEAGSSKTDLILFLPVCTQFQIIVKTSNDLSLSLQQGKAVNQSWDEGSFQPMFIFELTLSTCFEVHPFQVRSTSAYLTRI